MNTRVLSQHYNQLTREERLRLTFAAHARGDDAEAARLWESCPQMTLVAPDPKYSQLVHRMLHALNTVINLWGTVSHCVVRDCLAAKALQLASDYESLSLRTEGSSKNDVDALEADDDGLAAKAEASWKSWSAAWKGFEVATTRSCEELSLTLDQLFKVLDSPAVLTIDQARGSLHPGARAKRAVQESQYRRLRQAWVGDSM